MTLYFPDGNHEVVHSDDLFSFLKNLLERKCGREAAELLSELFEEKDDEPGDDYEAISDGYLQMLNSTADELDAVLRNIKNSKRINRDNLYDSLSRIKRNIISNT